MNKENCALKLVDEIVYYVSATTCILYIFKIHFNNMR